MYNHDIDILATQLIPPILRNERMLAWCKLLTWPIKRLWLQVLQHYSYLDGIIRYSGQVMYLRLAIEETTGYEVVIIDNANPFQQLYWYKINDATNDEQYIYSINDINDPLYQDKYIFCTNDYINDIDFIVRINPLTDNARRLATELIEQYKPAGKKYKVEQLIP